MADLSQLFQYSPEVAGILLGQQNALDQEKSRLGNTDLAQRIQLEAAKGQREADLFPLEKENKSLTNQGLAAGLPGIQANSDLAKTNAQKGAATLESDIAAAKAKNQGTIDDEKLTTLKRSVSTLTDLGNQMASVPAPLRRQYLEQAIKTTNMSESSPIVQMLRQMDPNQMPQFASALAKRLGDQALQMSPAARATMYSADKSSAATRYSADVRAGATRYAADKSAERAQISAATKSKAVGAVAAIQKGMDPSKVLMSAKLEYELTKDPDEKSLWLNVMTFADQAIQRKAQASNAGKPTITQDDSGNAHITPQTITPFNPNGTGPAPGSPEHTQSLIDKYTK